MVEMMQVGIQPEEVFAEVWTELRKRNKGEYSLNLHKLSKAFWDAREKYPAVMQGFSCQGSANEPYLHEIIECIHEFRQDGLLSFVSGKGLILSSDGEKLEGMFEKKTEVKETAKYICDRL
jgi:hypothetical protein